MRFQHLTAVLIAAVALLSTPPAAAQTTWEQDYDKGRAAFDQRNFVEAERLWKSALAKKAPLNLVQPKLAVLYTRLDRHAEAQAAYRQYFDSLGKPLPRQTQVADVAVSYAATLVRGGQFDEAEKWLSLAIDIHTNVTGPDSVNLADALTGMGATCLRAKRYEEAHVYFGKALPVLKAKRGPHSRDVVMVMKEDAEAHAFQGNLDEATRGFEEALKIELEKRKYSPIAAEIYRCMAHVHIEAGDFDKASRALVEARNIFALRSVARYREIAAFDVAEAALWLKHHRFGEAETAAQRVVNAVEKDLADKDEVYGGALITLGACNVARGKHAEAEAQYNKALTVMIKRFPYDHPATQLALTAYADLLRKIGRENQIDSIHAQAKAARAKVEAHQKQQKHADVR